MEVIDRFRLTLGRPRYGWLPFRVEIGDIIFEHHASAVLNDPVAELLDLLEFSIRSSCESARACLWIEPEGYAIDFVPSEQANQIEVRVYFDDLFVPPMRRHAMRLHLKCVLHRRTVTDGLTSGLAELLRGPNSSALDKWYTDCSSQSYLARFDELAPAGPEVFERWAKCSGFEHMLQIGPGSCVSKLSRS